MSACEYVQYGSGYCAPVGWHNFDASPTLRLQKLPLVGRLLVRASRRFPENVDNGDIVKGLPIAPSSCAAVYCSHILEHLSLADLRAALRNTHLVLKPGGIFRMVLPDLRYSMRKYSESTSTDAALEFLLETGLGLESRPRGLRGVLSAVLGNSRHLWMWDYESMAKELDAAGFVAIRRAQFGDSAEPRFADVEVEQRWVNCLGVECHRGPAGP